MDRAEGGETEEWVEDEYAFEEGLGADDEAAAAEEMDRWERENEGGGAAEAEADAREAEDAGEEAALNRAVTRR